MPETFEHLDKRCSRANIALAEAKKLLQEWYDAFGEDGSPCCPSCGRRTVRKVLPRDFYIQRHSYNCLVGLTLKILEA